MPLSSLADYKAFAGLTTTDAARDASLVAILAECEAAVKKHLHPNRIESETVTLYLDAPPSQTLILPHRPVRSITSIYHDPGAFYGTTSGAFDADTTLLVSGTDYAFIPDQPDGTSRAGKVLRIGRFWGSATQRYPNTLAGATVAEKGSLKVTCVVGYVSVPDDIALAVNLMAALVYRRRTGAPTQSEGWNGYNYSLASPFLATAAIQSPDVRALLDPYVPAKFA